jgi:hypothetical protein
MQAVRPSQAPNTLKLGEAGPCIARGKRRTMSMLGIQSQTRYWLRLFVLADTLCGTFTRPPHPPKTGKCLSAAPPTRSSAEPANVDNPPSGHRPISSCRSSGPYHASAAAPRGPPPAASAARCSASAMPSAGLRADSRSAPWTRDLRGPGAAPSASGSRFWEVPGAASRRVADGGSPDGGDGGDEEGGGARGGGAAA